MLREDRGEMVKRWSRRKDDRTKRNWSYLSSCSLLFHQRPQEFDGDGTDAQKRTHKIPKRILLTSRSRYHVGAVLCLLTVMDDLWLPCVGQPSVVHLCCVWPSDPWPGVSGSWASEAAAEGSASLVTRCFKAAGLFLFEFISPCQRGSWEVLAPHRGGRALREYHIISVRTVVNGKLGVWKY